MLTKERLTEMLSFNADEGRFYWSAPVRGIRVGMQAGSYDAHGYGQIRIDRRIYKEHHLVWLWMTGEFPKNQIDHINHDRRDNRPSNLRETTNTENHRNRPMQRNNTSGYVGVYLDRRGGYVSYITLDGVRKSLGRFNNLHDAIAARKQANVHYGFHENHGVGAGISKDPIQAMKQAQKRKENRLSRNISA